MHKYRIDYQVVGLMDNPTFIIIEDTDPESAERLFLRVCGPEQYNVDILSTREVIEPKITMGRG